jgi:cytochrome P450
MTGVDRRPATDTDLFAELLNPAYRHDPYPVYDRIRRRGPLWIEQMPAAVVGGYRDCEQLLRDPRLSAERWRYASSTMDRQAIPEDAPTSLWQPSFLTLDPPDHTRMRRLVTKAFNVSTVNRLEPLIGALVDELLDRAGDAPTFDVIDGLAYPLPVTLICRLLGVPEHEEYLFHGWSSQLSLFVDGLALAAAGSARTFDWLPATIEMHRYVEDLIEQRRADPGDDLISDLLAIEDAGDALTADELISTVILLLVTGHETTVNLIGNCVLALLRHTRYLDQLRADPGLATRIVEETIRYDPPVHLTARVAKEPIRIGDLDVAAGGLVFLLLAAAHRDEAANPRPDVFDPHRERINHIGFGVGIHYCVGAPLARTQTRIALVRFAQRLTDPSLAQDPPPYREHLNLHGPSALHVTHGGLRA